jgi:hypothetical protein
MSKAASPSSKLTRRKAIAATLAGIAAPALAGPCDSEEEDGDKWTVIFHQSLAAALEAMTL